MILVGDINIGVVCVGEGVIPGLLARWYSERKIMQATKRDWVGLKNGINIPERLA